MKNGGKIFHTDLNCRFAFCKQSLVERNKEYLLYLHLP